MELLGCVHPHMAVEAVGDHWGFCGNWSVGPQPSVQVASHMMTFVAQGIKVSLNRAAGVHIHSGEPSELFVSFRALDFEKICINFFNHSNS